MPAAAPGRRRRPDRRVPEPGGPPRRPAGAATAARSGEFGDLAARWAVAYRLAVVGGCCGASPAHIGALAARLDVPVAAAD
ncbi:homocysteine S-methyltransferase family protein [Micromonospora sp. CA-263727]|uniref:homocysteine S-methyltransferase family protein n=1 Tax=Micromonospora sp. CA-263727 TaxID=3239967 RepID=UPI003D9435E8